MKTRTRNALSLSAAIGLALAFSSAQAGMSDDCAQKAAESAQATEQVATATAASAVRTTQTGSHIARVRRDGSLPVSEYDRTYIDRTGAATTADMLRTIPQIQVGR